MCRLDSPRALPCPGDLPSPTPILYSNFPSSRSLHVSHEPGLFPSSTTVFPTSDLAPGALPWRKALFDKIRKYNKVRFFFPPGLVPIRIILGIGLSRN
jgi:hypothetical protein